MGFFSKDIRDMNDLFVAGLKDIYYVETAIVDALPELISKATMSELKGALKFHLDETENHVRRVEQVFEMHGVSPETIDSPAIDGILEEGNDIISDVDDKRVLDAALIAAAQKVEHYEITSYGTLIAWAKALGRDDCAAVLKQNLDEEKAADAKLSALAEEGMNRMAA